MHAACSLSLLPLCFSSIYPQRKTWQHHEWEWRVLSYGESRVQRDRHAKHLTAPWVPGTHPLAWQQHGALGTCCHCQILLECQAGPWVLWGSQGCSAKCLAWAVFPQQHVQHSGQGQPPTVPPLGQPGHRSAQQTQEAPEQAVQGGPGLSLLAESLMPGGFLRAFHSTANVSKPCGLWPGELKELAPTGAQAALALSRDLHTGQVLIPVCSLLTLDRPWWAEAQTEPPLPAPSSSCQSPSLTHVVTYEAIGHCPTSGTVWQILASLGVAAEQS